MSDRQDARSAATASPPQRITFDGDAIENTIQSGQDARSAATCRVCGAPWPCPMAGLYPHRKDTRK